MTNTGEDGIDRDDVGDGGDKMLRPRLKPGVGEIGLNSMETGTMSSFVARPIPESGDKALNFMPGDKSRSPITSRVDGSFRAWTGEEGVRALFVLLYGL